MKSRVDHEAIIPVASHAKESFCNESKFAHSSSARSRVPYPALPDVVSR